MKRNNETEEHTDADKTADSRDKVTISGDAREVSGLSEIRADKVEAVRKAIEAGEYNPDYLNVAKKVLEKI